jgi:lipopolysaccharide biosynthesis glycosyltransferase
MTVGSVQSNHRRNIALSPVRKGSSTDARSWARSVARRGLARVGPLKRAAQRAAGQRQTLDRLVSMYEALRHAYAERSVPAADVPSASDIEAVQAEALKAKTLADFFETLSLSGDFDRALVSMTRGLIRRPGGTSRARIIAQAFHQHEELRPITEICLAVCLVEEPMPEPAWTLFTRNDIGLVVRWAAQEYFQLAFRRDPASAADTLVLVLNGEIRLEADPHVWIEIAYHAFSAGSHDLAGQTLERAEAAMATVTDPARIARLQARLSTLREWLDRAAQAGQIVATPDGEIPFALVGFKHPDWGSMSRDLDDPTETLAALGHLLRHKGLEFTGDPGLASAARQLSADVPPESRIDGPRATVRLYEVDRDVSRYAAVPGGTWVIVSEWFTLPLAGSHYDMPLNPNLRPIFVSFHITPSELRAPGVVDYLRRYGPIGCRDWDTVFLLHAAGISAFFSGALTMTVDTVVRPAAAQRASSTLFVDVAPNGPGQQRSRFSAAVKDRDLADNLNAAATELRRYRDGGARVVTSDLRLYLAVRAVGCPAELLLEDDADYRVIDFTELSDDEFAAMQRGISDKLAAVLAAVLAGRPESDVYETWREACAAEVARAEAQLTSINGYPRLSFDLAEVCTAIRSASVTIERTEPGPPGPEINIEFSVDENYKHQLDIVLDSVVEHASRPVRAFVLCRGLGRDDFDRMAELFPTVSFVWLPTDNVDYGQVRGKIKWATIVTMDRTILPVLLADVDRLIHLDLDALCLSDLAELFDIDMEGMPIAAADEPQPSYGRGYDSFRDSVRLLRREGHPDLARELMIRVQSEHPFDFNIFNAGIMLLDLAKMRADDFCGRYLAYVERFGINGQRVLNVGVGRARKKISADWNRLMRLEVADSPKIAHWAGPFKPWRGHQYVPGRELWRAQEERFAARTERLRPVATPVNRVR